MLRIAKAPTFRVSTHRLVSIRQLARRVERAVWSVLVALLWPAVFTLMAAIAGLLAGSAVTPTATLEANLLFSLLLALFVLVMGTALVDSDDEPGRLP